MKLGDVVFVTNSDGVMVKAKVVGVSQRFFGERRKDERAVKDTNLVEIEGTGVIMLDLRGLAKKPS